MLKSGALQPVVEGRVDGRSHPGLSKGYRYSVIKVTWVLAEPGVTD